MANIVLSGMLDDGAQGLKDVFLNHGETWIQDPAILLTLTQAKDSMSSKGLVALIKVAAPHSQLSKFILEMVDYPDDWVAYTAIEHLIHVDEAAADAIKRVLAGHRNLPQLAAIKVVQRWTTLRRGNGLDRFWILKMKIFDLWPNRPWGIKLDLLRWTVNLQGFNVRQLARSIADEVGTIQSINLVVLK